MTTPHPTNCPHNDKGWCLDCVKQQLNATEQLRKASWNTASQCYGYNNGILKIEYDTISELRQALTEYTHCIQNITK